ncbi:hypothetical protein GQS78_08110 [Thermococcus bergensis]|uniref:hypothetical protein n=1 Tax=Thermococcus bergensis TaxID=2689387 RepID=UPI001CEC22AB|nr:hypothetical protein [Thermococcus bergensis]MCA6214209.1 hypothetical protein [Thermococcus bergensis]
MKLHIQIGSGVFDSRRIMVSFLIGAVITSIILVWQLSGVIEKPMVRSISDFVVASFGFALLVMTLAGIFETISANKRNPKS